MFAENGNNFALLTTDDWQKAGLQNYDARFEAEFSPLVAPVVPEPTSLLLLGTGGLGLLARARRRTRG